MAKRLKNPVVIFGFGSQGKAHALNLQDSGEDVIIVLPKSSLSIADAESANFNIETDPRKAAEKSDLLVFLTPDSVHKLLYKEIEDNVRSNSTLIFAHGLNVHYEIIKPRDDLDIVLVAPMAQGDSVRKMYLNQVSIPTLIAVNQNITGRAWKTAKDYAISLGAEDKTIIETTFKEETETDLFSEQCLTVGGLWGLITLAFDTLVEEGYSPEIAYYCCLKEIKILSDMFARFGIVGTFKRISDTARFGALSRGKRVIGDSVKKEMKSIMKEIQDGVFIKELQKELQKSDSQASELMLEKISEHRIEILHKKLSSEEKE